MPSDSSVYEANTLDDASVARAPPIGQFWKKPVAKSADPNVEKYSPIPYWKLFGYASRRDRLMMDVAMITAACQDAMLPVFIAIFAQVLDDFGTVRCPVDELDCGCDPALIAFTLSSNANWFLYVSFIVEALSFVEFCFALIAANRMGSELRHRFFDSLSRQDCDFYDDSEADALILIVISDIQRIQGGIGDKPVLPGSTVLNRRGGPRRQRERVYWVKRMPFGTLLVPPARTEPEQLWYTWHHVIISP